MTWKTGQREWNFTVKAASMIMAALMALALTAILLRHFGCGVR